MDLAAIISLVAAGVLFILAEIFVPGGFVGGIGLVLLAAGIVGGFIHSATLGFGLLIGSLVFGLAVLWLWLKFLPYSPFGKRIVHQGDAAKWHSYDSRQSELVGKLGTAKSPLHPGGIAVIDGNRIDVVTRGERVAAGTEISVIKVEGNRVVVSEVKQTEGKGAP